MAEAWDVSKLEKALADCIRLHANSIRDGRSPFPYGTHPIDVANILRYEGGCEDENSCVAALLHDTLESGSIEIGQLEKQYGHPVSKLVIELTRSEPSADEIASLTKAEIREIRSKLLLEDISRMSIEAQRIKLADRLSNLRLAGQTRSGKRLDRYLDQTRAILAIISPDVCPSLWRKISDLVNQTLR